MVFRPFYFLVVLVLITFPLKLSAQDTTPANFVNTFIGTANNGNTHPGALYPGGMVQVIPQNIDPPISANSHIGYSFGWRKFYGLSGINKNLILLPFYGKEYLDYFKRGTYYKNEDASPGYYKVSIGGSSALVPVEVTATKQTAMFRIKFPSDTLAKMIFYRNADSKDDLNIGRGSVIEGKVDSLYYCMLLSRNFSKCEIVEGEKYLSNMGLYLEFQASQEDLIVKMGISNISVEEAYRNIMNENPTWNFDLVAKEAFNAWDNILSDHILYGLDSIQNTMYNTALYHTIMYGGNLEGTVKNLQTGEILSNNSIKKIINRYYTATPGGLPRAMDCGEASSWLVKAMKKLYSDKK